MSPRGASLHPGRSVWLTPACQQLGVHSRAAPCLKPPPHPACWKRSGHTRTPHPQAGPGGGRGPGQAPNPGPPLNTCGQITQPALSLALLGARWGKHGPHGPSPRPALARDAHGKNTGKTDGDRLPGSAVTEQGKQGHACPHPPRLPLPYSLLRAHTSKF